MGLAFDPICALGDLPQSHASRFRFLAEADPSVIGTINLGILFVMAFWSVPSRMAFKELKRVLQDTDPGGLLELVVVDTDGCQDLHSLPEFAGKLHGAGEAAWIKDGTIVRTSGLGYNPGCFKSFTQQLLQQPA